jgi:uncharacterized protein (DUF427 family)
VLLRDNGPMSESVWDYPRPPRLEPSVRRLTVEHHGVLVAASARGWRVLETSHPPVYYLPAEDVRTELLTRAARHTFCEYKGVADYWDLALPDGTVVREVAWSYPQPTAAYVDLTGALAFYAGRVDRATVDGVQVTPQSGDFYGGWVTPEIVGPFKS